MPGKLYFYCNFGTIKLNKANSKVKSFGRPLLRDLEWEFFLLWDEARGFSGFSEDDVNTCARPIKDLADQGITEPTPFIHKYYPNTIASDGTLKRYVPARQYLRSSHPLSLGHPIYENEAKNLFMLGARGYGKSYMMSAIIAHEFLFDGKTHYDLSEETTAAEVMIGAGDAKYSSETLSKVKVILDMLPGKFETSGRYYPAPFSKKFMGS